MSETKPVDPATPPASPPSESTLPEPFVAKKSGASRLALFALGPALLWAIIFTAWHSL